jgi:hypothetical protein
MASSGKGVDVRGEVVNLLLEQIASDRNPSVTMMNMVEELLAPDDVPHKADLGGGLNGLIVYGRRLASTSLWEACPVGTEG